MEILKQNLIAIFSVNRLLYERICLPVDDSHIKFENGIMHYKIHKTFYPISKEKLELNYDLDELLNISSLMIFGCEVGFILNSLIENQYNGKIIVWERDPWLLRLLLMKRDYSNEIYENKLQFFLGVDIFDLINYAESLEIVYIPFFKKIYKNEFNIITEGVKEKIVFLCSGTLFIDDIAESLESLGFTVYIWEHIKLSIEESKFLFKKRKPDLVISVNYALGISEFCNNHKVKYICWEIDPSIDILKPVLTSTNESYIFSYRKKNLDQFRIAGFKNLFHLPLASNINKRKPAKLSDIEVKKYKAEVSFVGDSMVMEAKRQREIFRETFVQNSNENKEEALKKANSIFDSVINEQSKNWDNFIVDKLCDKYLNDFLNQPKDLNYKKYDWVMLIGEMAASKRRLYYIERLIPFNIHVWGDEGWKQLAVKGLPYRGEAGHYKELTKIYNSTLINIDINRFYQKDIVTMRVFDVLACGGFIIAEYSDDLKNLFKIGEEVESFSTIDELHDKIAYYLKNRDKAKRIAENGSCAVIERHSISSRVNEMLKKGRVVYAQQLGK